MDDKPDKINVFDEIIEKFSDTSLRFLSNHQWERIAVFSKTYSPEFALSANVMLTKPSGYEYECIAHLIFSMTIDGDIFFVRCEILANENISKSLAEFEANKLKKILEEKFNGM